ncbi:hypothetical protein Hdeb2414_s0016g00469031 [Helianthus debilis subsp. tardiflorus]
MESGFTQLQAVFVLCCCWLGMLQGMSGSGCQSGVNKSGFWFSPTESAMLFLIRSWCIWVCVQLCSWVLLPVMKSHFKATWSAGLWYISEAQMALQRHGLTLVWKAQVVELMQQWKALTWVLKMLSNAQAGTAWCLVKAQLWVVWRLCGPGNRLFMLPLKSCTTVFWDTILASSFGLCTCCLGPRFMGSLKPQLGLVIIGCRSLDGLARGAIWATESHSLGWIAHWWYRFVITHGAIRKTMMLILNAERYGYKKGSLELHRCNHFFYYCGIPRYSSLCFVRQFCKGHYQVCIGGIVSIIFCYVRFYCRPKRGRMISYFWSPEYVLGMTRGYAPLTL